MKSAFTARKQLSTAQLVGKVFKLPNDEDRAPKGSNKHMREKRVETCWWDLLEDLQGIVDISYILFISIIKIPNLRKNIVYNYRNAVYASLAIYNQGVRPQIRLLGKKCT